MTELKDKFGSVGAEFCGMLPTDADTTPDRRWAELTAATAFSAALLAACGGGGGAGDVGSVAGVGAGTGA